MKKLLLPVVLALLLASAWSLVQTQASRGLSIEDFLLDDDSAHVEGIFDTILDPITNFCPLSGSAITTAEAAMRSKLPINYKQDAAAVFFSANEYNTIGIDKPLQNYYLVKVFQVATARASLHANDVDKILIVSAQGTEGDWTSVNYAYQLVANYYGPGKVHAGFLNEVSSIVNYNAKEILTRIKGFLDRGYLVIFTGHSQGGAECLLYAQAAYQAYPSYVSKMRIVSVAAPRTGNSDFANGLINSGIDAVRYAASADPFTKVPTEYNCYQHVGEPRTVSCAYSSINVVFCHYPDIYFDDINNRQATPFPVKGISIADQYNYDKNYLSLAMSRVI